MTTAGTPPDPHEDERIDELLAGYVLRSLTGDDAVEADRLLSEHVPGCDRCRETLVAFSETVADLALDADPMPPPETLLPRLHRELEPASARQPPDGGRWWHPASPRSWSWEAWPCRWASGPATCRTATTCCARPWRSRSAPAPTPRRSVVPMRPKPAPVSEITAPDEDHFYLIGEDVPAPPAGLVYGIWLSDGADLVFAGTFLPARR